MNSLVETIASALGDAKKTASGYLCKCPCHADNTASLSLKVTSSGGILLNCFAGCDWQDIKKEIESRGLIKPSANRPSSNGTNGSNSNGASHHTESEIIYSYRDANNALVFEKIRKPDKKFVHRRHTASGIEYNLQGINEKPLYKLPEVLAAIKNNQPIAILEGEKDCENFTGLTGIIATTNFDGASPNKWKEHYSKSLSGADIILLYDNDDPGRLHRDAIIQSVKQYARSISIIHLPSELNDKPIKDFSDWLFAGGTLADYQAITPEVVPIPHKIESVNASDWLKLPVAKQDPILFGAFDLSDKVLIVGQSKTKKSFFTQQLAFCIAAGRSFVGFSALEPRKVLLVQSEIKADKFHSRCVRMANSLGMLPSDLSNLVIVNARGGNNQQAIVEEHALQQRPAVIIVDPLYKLIAGDENKSEDVKPILQFFDSLAERVKATVIYVHHDRKGYGGDQQLTDRGSGTGILGRDYDAAIYLSLHKDQESALVVDVVSRNYAPQPPLVIEWFDAHFGPSEASADKRTSRNALEARRKGLEEYVEAARKLLARLYMEGVRQLGMNQFNDRLEAIDIKHRRLAAVKERLVELGIIEITTRKAAAGVSSKYITLLDTVEQQVDDPEDSIPF